MTIQVTRSSDRRVAHLQLAGGELDPASARGISDACAELVEDREVRAVVLESGPDFCTGPSADLDVLQVDPDPASAVARLRVPVVAVVTGRCASVGLEVLLACDVRLAAPDAAFAFADLAESARLPAWGGSQRLPRAVGHARASAMLLLGSEIDAITARTWGLVHEVGEPASLLAATLEQLAGIGPLAAELAKEAVHRGSELPLRDGLRLEGDLNHLLAATDDRAEGLAAFFDKRPPDFSGR